MGYQKFETNEKKVHHTLILIKTKIVHFAALFRKRDLIYDPDSWLNIILLVVFSVFWVFFSVFLA